jgi:crotonobetainyl-CoA:carnitine CoA-transferase CaiB-like acyl-CoA transferase
MAGPLQGLKVLDFTTLLPGPYATMLLADMGAEVLRIVSPSRPDLVDFFPPFVPGTTLSAASAYLGRNKRSMALNLKIPSHRRRAPTAHDYDVVVEQFRPASGQARPDTTPRKVNPRIVYAPHRVRPTGPFATGRGHANLFLTRPLRDLLLHGQKVLGTVPVSMQMADVASAPTRRIGICGCLRPAADRGGAVCHLSMTDG